MQDYFLKGFVGAAPENKEAKGMSVTKFIIAVNCGNAGKPKKMWVKCTAWRELADCVSRSVFQGDLIAVNGRIEDVEAWIDPKSGKAKGALAVKVSEVFTMVRPGEFRKV